MKTYIITLKCEKNPNHNPRVKFIGNCPLSKLNESCTDITGEHHSVLVKSEKDLMLEIPTEFMGFKITRIEEVKLILEIK